LKILYRQGKLEIAVPGSFEQAQATARALTDCIDKALSIFSQDSISWNREVSKKFNGKNIPIGEQELLRWAVAPKGVRTDYGKNAGGLQDSIGILANAITELSGSEKVFFDKIYNCFLNVWLAPHFELYLVLWHACLDAFKHHYGFSGQPFSQNLVKACQAANVTFSDLFPIDFKKLQSGKEKFIFTELRNEYLHNGLIIEDFLVAVEQIKKMKALANRFLMRFLKLDENFCSLGETYTPW
jgi:hypothetical protein